MAHQFARLRSSARSPTYDPHADAPMAQLEIVAGREEPNFGPALASFPISGNAHLHSVGDLVVAIAQAVRHGDPESRGACQDAIIDAAAKPAPTKLAVLMDSELCTARDLIEEQPAFASSSALVFVRRLPRLAESADGSAPTESILVLDWYAIAPAFRSVRKPGAKSLRFHDGHVELLPEPFTEKVLDALAYTDTHSFQDETLLDARDEELLLLRYGSLRRAPRGDTAPNRSAQSDALSAPRLTPRPTDDAAR